MKMFKKGLLLMMLASFATSKMDAQTNPQIENSDFETWEFDGDNLPSNWNSFQTAEGQFASLGYSANNRQVKRSDNVRPGSTGKSSVVIWCRTVLNIPAQGNLTIGCVNAGSTSASNPANYNFSKTSDENKSEKLDFVQKNGQYITPDSLVAWVRFVPKTSTYKARISSTIHGDYDYITYGAEAYDNDENRGQAYAQAYSNFGKTDWKRISMPFKKTGNDVVPKYIIVNISTNAEPGVGTKDDSLYIDDIELIYNPVMYAVTVKSSSNRMGTVSVTGLTKGKVAEGSIVTISAVAKEGYKFVKWSDGSTEAERSIEVTEDLALVAEFESDGTGEPINPDDGDDDDDDVEPGENSYVPCVAPTDEIDTPGGSTVEHLQDDAEAKVVGNVFVPVNMTDKISNPSFEDGTNGWTVTKNGNAVTVGGQDNMKNVEFFLNNYSNGFFGLGKTNSAFSVSQTINNLDNGIYKVTVQAFNRRGAVNNITGEEVIGVVLNANDESVVIKNIADEATEEPVYMLEDGAWPSDVKLSNDKYVADGQEGVSAHFAEGQYLNELMVEVTNGTLTIGLSKPDYNMSKEWTCLDNFTLTYYGNDTEIFSATLPKQNTYIVGEEAEVEFKVSQYVNFSEEGTVTVAVVDEAGNELSSNTVNTETATGKISVVIPDDIDAGEYTLACYYSNSELTASKQIVIDYPATIANLEVEAWGIEPVYNLYKDETTAEISVDFEYTDSYPEAGWKYAYLYIFDAQHNKTLIGYSRVTSSSVKGNLPNNVESGEFSVMLLIGRDGACIMSDKFTINVEEHLYEVAFTIEGEEIKEQYKLGDEIEVPAPEPREGYTLVWDNPVPARVTGDLSFVGTWVPNQYYVAFVDEEGTEYYGELLDYGTEITVPETPVREGFIFKGWDIEVPATVPANDITFTAVWEADAITSISALGEAVEYYTLGGVRINAPRKGVNIVKFKNGMSKKIVF